MLNDDDKSKKVKFMADSIASSLHLYALMIKRTCWVSNCGANAGLALTFSRASEQLACQPAGPLFWRHAANTVVSLNIGANWH